MRKLNRLTKLFSLPLYILLTFVVFSRDFPCSDYTRPLFMMTAQFFFIKEMAWYNVCQIHTFLSFTKSRLREKIQFFLKNCFNTEKYPPYLKSVTHFMIINGSFQEEEWRRRSCRSRSESTFWRNYFFRLSL